MIANETVDFRTVPSPRHRTTIFKSPEKYIQISNLPEHTFTTLELFYGNLSESIRTAVVSTILEGYTFTEPPIYHSKNYQIKVSSYLRTLIEGQCKQNDITIASFIRFVLEKHTKKLQKEFYLHVN